MSMSFSKWKNLFPINRKDNFNKKSKKETTEETLEPEVGFKLILDPNEQPQNYTATSSFSSFDRKQNVPELNIHIIGARHLPSLFGIKVVEGYLIRVKLFPGATRFETSIQTNSWPKFNETFKFPLQPTLKSSIRSRTKEECLAKTLPEKLFKGHFVVLTVYALLELPPGALNPIKEKYQSFKRKGSILLKEKNIIKNDGDKTDKGNNNNVINLTKSESRRNIGSVTCFLDPKIFLVNSKTGHYCSEELWLPVKDITLTFKSTAHQPSSSSSLKGQVEITLQITESKISDELQRQNSSPPITASITTTPSTNPFETETTVDIFKLNNPDHMEDDDSLLRTNKNNNTNNNNKNGIEITPATSKSRWSLNDMKKKITGSIKDKQSKNNSCFNITVTRMRCSIKVKEEFESIAGEEMYLKVTVFERGILSEKWKSKVFKPTLSLRWDSKESTVSIPLVNDYDIDYVSIKITIATKSIVGKKTFLGTLILGPNLKGEVSDHWDEMVNSKGSPVTRWHCFE